MRARDLFYALWIPDLFMERVEANGSWSLFCPNEAPRLADTVGAEFKALYEKYEADGCARRTVRAQELWFAILQAQIETGTPYMLYKDACNLKSNQQNLGVIKSSNLCTGACARARVAAAVATAPAMHAAHSSSFSLPRAHHALSLSRPRRDPGVHVARRDRRVQPGVHRAEHVRQPRRRHGRDVL
jgi:hypothetical protein